MKSKEEILKTMKKELPYLKKKFNVRSIGIFSSYVRGRANKNKRSRPAC